MAALALAVEASTNSKRPEWIEARPEAIEDIGALRALVRGKLDYLGCNSTHLGFKVGYRDLETSTFKTSGATSVLRHFNKFRHVSKLLTREWQMEHGGGSLYRVFESFRG